MFSEDCPFKVVRTNGGDEVLARAANLLIGRAAFETARRMYPGDLIEYRRGAQGRHDRWAAVALGRRSSWRKFSLISSAGTLPNNAASYMTTIVLTRHGHVDGIRPKRFRGREDLTLTQRGEAESRAVAEFIAAQWRPTKVYTSPLRRCVATGAAIASACHVEAVVFDGLNDLDYGSWQFKTYEEIEHADPQLFAQWFAAPHLVRFPGGESLQDLVARTADALRFVLKHHVDDTVVLVGHDSVNRTLLLQLLDQPLSSYWRLAQDPCCINEIDVVDWSIRVRRINETQHLREIEGGYVTPDRR